MKVKSDKAKKRWRFGPANIICSLVIVLLTGAAVYFSLKTGVGGFFKIVIIFFIAVLFSNSLALYIYKVLKKSRGVFHE